jgi:hypothetical protein
VIADWKLDEFVEEAKAGRFKPHGGNRTWRRKPWRSGELTQDWEG